jgi:SpoVK/Ycf46/Vps4 family AAA+-type ATPase
MTAIEGFLTSSSDTVYVLGATNRPFAMDSGELRRFKLRLLIDLPEKALRAEIIGKYFRANDPTTHALTDAQLRWAGIRVQFLNLR